MIFPAITEKEKSIARVVQGDLPLVRKPFEEAGRRIGTTGAEALETIRSLVKRGIIRKFGAILKHREAGFRRNAMVVWAVPPERCEEIGGKLAACRDITHCYERTPPFEGIYTIFTMVHCRDEEPEQRVAALARHIGIDSYAILRSLEEYKKSSMEYFS